MRFSSSIIFPCLFLLTWYLALSGATPPGAADELPLSERALNWLLYFSGFAFISASYMHSFKAKWMAASIGWESNGFQYEIAAVSLGLGAGCFYALYASPAAKIAISFPIISFLFLAGMNHLKEVIFQKNYAPNNTFILIWDFGVSISLLVLLLSRNSII